MTTWRRTSHARWCRRAHLRIHGGRDVALRPGKRRRGALGAGPPRARAGGTLVLADGRLLIYTDGGQLIVADAARRAYRDGRATQLPATIGCPRCSPRRPVPSAMRRVCTAFGVPKSSEKQEAKSKKRNRKQRKDRIMRIVVSALWSLYCHHRGPRGTTRARRGPANQWAPMNEPSAGVQMLGWDEIRYAPDLGGVVFFGAFRGTPPRTRTPSGCTASTRTAGGCCTSPVLSTANEMTSDAGPHVRPPGLRRGAPRPGLRRVDEHGPQRPRAHVDLRPLTPRSLGRAAAGPDPGIPFDAATIYVPELKGTFLYHPSPRRLAV